MKPRVKKFHDFWFGLDPDMTKEERKLALLFQWGYIILPLSVFITWRMERQTLAIAIACVIQVSWQIYFAIAIKRQRNRI